MCIDTMATEGRKPCERRPNCFWRRKAVFTGAAGEADVRRYARKLLKKSGRRSRNRAWEKDRSTHAFPTGAMAPRNTTQYLMELIYSDLNITAQSSGPTHYLHPHYADDEDSMNFEHRDFESVFFHTESGADAIFEAAILETEPLNTFKINRRACAAGGSWLCVMCRRPECKPRPRLLRHLSAQVNLLHLRCVLCCICCVLCVRVLQVCCSTAVTLS